MADIILVIRINDREVEEGIDRLLEKSADITAILKLIGEALLQTTDERFDSESGPDGQAWAPLSPWTLQNRRRAGESILTQSGRLRGSIVYQVTGDTLRLGPNTVYAAAQQFGSTHTIRATEKALAFTGLDGQAMYRKQVTVDIPARPYIGFGEADRRATIETLEDYYAALGAVA